MKQAIFEVSFDSLASQHNMDDRVALRDLVGHTVVMVATEYVAMIETSNGNTDALSVHIHDITKQRSHYNQLVFARVIVNGLKDKIGAPVLGVVARGKAKPGKSSPWVLEAATEGRKTRAARYMKRLQDQAPAS